MNGNQRTRERPVIKIEFMVLTKGPEKSSLMKLDRLARTLRIFCDNLEKFFNEDDEQESVPCRTCGKFFLIKELIFYGTEPNSSQCDACYEIRTGRPHPSTKEEKDKETL